MSEYFAVIDTETNFLNEAMSVGIVIGEKSTFDMIDGKYFIIKDASEVMGIFSDVLYYNIKEGTHEYTRKETIQGVCNILKEYEVDEIFAYNGSFDKSKLPELNKFRWFDIMKIAAYKQFNKKITPCYDCFSSGKLKRNYKVENIMAMLTGDCNYREIHNAYEDAKDEMLIMKLLNLDFKIFERASI